MIGRFMGAVELSEMKKVNKQIALIVIPLIVLAGLFVWLKVTEEQEDDLLELDRDGA